MIRLFKLFLVMTLAVGFCRGWFAASTVSAAKGKDGALVLTWNPGKIKDDLAEALDQVHALANLAMGNVDAETETETETETTTPENETNCELVGNEADVDLPRGTITLEFDGQKIQLPIREDDIVALSALPAQ